MSRGLESVEIATDGEGRPVLICLCDYATVTDVVLAIKLPADGVAPPPAQWAYTCDGCGTAHWFTLTLHSPT